MLRSSQISPQSIAQSLVWFLAVWLLGILEVAAVPGEKTYTVRRGDTLSGIAHSHGVPLTRLLERNRLRRSAAIQPGQRLIVPLSVKRPSKPGPQTGLPNAVERAIVQAPVKSGRWKRIVIHHSGVNTGTLAGMDRYHREVRHMENGLAYHFVIGNNHGLGDGEIGVGARWTKQLDGGHLISEEQNKYSIGICLVGNFDKYQPTPRQMERLTALVQSLLRRCQLSETAVTTHQQINLVHTRCPGRYFPMRKLMSNLGG